MRQEGRRPWRPLLWISLVGGIASAVGFALVATLLASETLPAEILQAITTLDRTSPIGDLIIICGPPTGAGRGIQFGLLGLLLGGVPAAILAATLRTRRRTRERKWSGDWEKVFFAGFVFQVNSLAFTALVLGVLLLVSYDAAAHSQEIVSFAVPMTLSLGCGVWGVRSWRTLQSAVEPSPEMISLRQRA